ncbi:MAG: YraN family protein [Cyclobacteriaceae bacterium]
MSKNKKIGDWGEEKAAEYLVERGYKIVDRNYRYSRGEIDIIALKANLLIFIEVKTRSNISYGYPEDFVDDKKAEWVYKVADQYVHEIDWQGGIRFDVISILKNPSVEIRHFEDAFH